MSTERPPQPHERSGLIILALIDLAAAVWLGNEISTIGLWKTAQADSYTMAEAAYLGSLWTKVLAHVGLLLAFNVFCLGVGICVRVSQLHRAVLWQGGARPPVEESR